MTLEEFIYQGANTSGISNVSTRGQPIGYPAPCSVNPTRKLTECTHRIICGNDNGEIINDTLSWNNTSEGNDYWCNLYRKSYSSKK